MLPRWKSAVKGFLNAVKEIFQVFLSQRFILACTEELKEPLIIKQFIYFFVPKALHGCFFFFFLYKLFTVWTIKFVFYFTN